jgi:DNA repair protein RadD
VRCLVGVDVFSVGFDAPAVDLIAIARPTASPVWHVQSAGRGTRLAPGKSNCLVLDFAGNFDRLGPIDSPHIRSKGARPRGDEDAPLVRGCPHCAALIAARSASCPVCGGMIARPRRTDTLSASAAPSIDGVDVLTVNNIEYAVHHKPGRPDSLRIEYEVADYCYPTVAEWICAWHNEGWIRTRARGEWFRRLSPDAPRHLPTNAAEAAAVARDRLRQPTRIRIWREREFTRVAPLFDETSIERRSA